MTPASELVRLLDFLDEFADVVVGRVASARPPSFVADRDWEAYLSALSSDDLERAETDTASFLLDAPGVPPSLRRFASEARDVTRLARLEPSDAPIRERMVKQRKSSQIAAFIALVRALGVDASRSVDVGTGMGHLSRIASERLQRGALGLDWNPRLLETANLLAEGTRATYRVLDALGDALPIEANDLVVGLHACGEVTDVALKAAARVRARVAFVSCCLQKVRGGERPALSRDAERRGFVLSREVLGLSNLFGRAQGIEVAQATSLEAREARHALRLLLEGRGVSTLPGEEMRGVNRRRARRGFATLAREVCAARGLEAPHDLELAHTAAAAHVEFARMRRWAVPRALVARVVECAVARDRAHFLAEMGYSVRVVEAFAPTVSPRNVALVGSPEHG